ncbi:MAG: serine/threonine-protein kinase [Proteobacteria bacterium]|nr:serine/threonine-protein kinase [Pseudomonadota bacterium]
MLVTEKLDPATSSTCQIIELPVSRRPDSATSEIEGFEVLAPIARGGMGGVYLGSDRRSGEKVALKLLDPRYARSEDIVARLFAEERISAAVHHDNLLEVRGCGYTTANIPYLVLEYLDGENLGELAERGRMEIDAIIGICTQIGHGLEALHAAGIVHCDVKPDNIFVLYEDGYGGWPRVKVIDYGVSQFVSEIVPNEATIAGTPACMAPEQWLGAPCTKSDVYGFGCMMFELLTGDSVFAGSLPEMMLAHTRNHPPRASWLRSDCPTELERLILRMLAKDPGLRPTMTEVVDQLAELLGHRLEIAKTG